MKEFRLPNLSPKTYPAISLNSMPGLPSRLRRLLGKQSDLPHNDVLRAIHSDIRQLQDGGLKECQKCKELRTAEEFNDASLASGVGRFCTSCKGGARGFDQPESRHLRPSPHQGPILVRSAEPVWCFEQDALVSSTGAVSTHTAEPFGHLPHRQRVGLGKAVQCERSVRQ